MCIRNLILALAVATVSGRPQVPQYFQQQTLVSMQLNNNYSDRISLPKQSQRVLRRTENEANTEFLNAENSRDPAGTQINMQYFHPKLVNANKNNYQKPALANSQVTAKTSMDNQLTSTKSNLHNQQFMNTNPVLNYPKYQATPAHTNCSMQNNEKRTDGDQETREGNMTTLKKQAGNTKTTHVNQQNLPVNNGQTTMTFQTKFTPVNTEFETENRINNKSSIERQMNESHIYGSDPENPDHDRKTVILNKNDHERRSSNSSLDSKPVLASGPANLKPRGPNHKSTDIEDDRQIWGYSDGATEKVDQSTTPDVFDRASFDGGTCPSGKVKVLGKCVDED